MRAFFAEVGPGMLLVVFLLVCLAFCIELDRRMTPELPPCCGQAGAYWDNAEAHELEVTTLCQ